VLIIEQTSPRRIWHFKDLTQKKKKRVPYTFVRFFKFKKLFMLGKGLQRDSFWILGPSLRLPSQRGSLPPPYTKKFSSAYGKLEKFDLISILGCNFLEIFFNMHVMNFQTKSWRNFELSNAVISLIHDS
jgi:hypothetical protein